MSELINRNTVYAAIDSERAYQDAGKGNAHRTGVEEGKPLTPGEIILTMEKSLADAREVWYKPGGPEMAGPFVRKVAALAVQYGERYGFPNRE